MPEDKTDDKTDDRTDDDTDDGDDDEKIEVSKSEYEATQAERAKLRRKVKAAEKAAADAKAAADRKAAEDEGKWKELAEEKEREAAEAKRDLAERDKKDAVSKVAKRMDFVDPDDVFRFISDEDLDDEASIKRALTALKDDKPYLVGEPRQPGGPTRTRSREKKPADMDQLIRGRRR